MRSGPSRKGNESNAPIDQAGPVPLVPEAGREADGGDRVFPAGNGGKMNVRSLSRAAILRCLAGQGFA
jgi:hypothetical protein